MNIKITSYSVGPIEINRELWENKPIDDFEVKQKSVLRYSTSKNVVGFQFDLLVSQRNSEVLKIGFVIGLDVEGWADMLASGYDPQVDRSAVEDICAYAWIAATGIVAALSTTDNSSGLILPDIAPSDIASSLLILSV